MQRFRFTLQALLTVRQRQENVALERYANALALQQQALEKLAATDAAILQAASALGGRLGSGIRAGELAHLGNHLRQLNLDRAAAERNAAAATKAVAPAFRDMLDSRRQREIVEECRARQRQRHLRDSLHAETRALDELAIQRFHPAAALSGNL